MCKPVIQNTKFAAASAPFFVGKNPGLAGQPYNGGFAAGSPYTNAAPYNPKQLYEFNMVQTPEGKNVKLDLNADQLLNLWTTVKDVNVVAPAPVNCAPVPVVPAQSFEELAPIEASAMKNEDNLTFDDLSLEFPELQDTDITPLFDILLDDDVADILSEFVESDSLGQSSGTAVKAQSSQVQAISPKAKSSHHKICSHEGCTKYVRSRGLCKAHGGSLQCVVPDCGRQSQGNGLCIKHGGGRRCEVPKCNRAAQSNHRCKKHGGGQRCTVEGCYKSSQGGGLCRSHGGGQRCGAPGCSKGAQRDGYCAAHGGIRLCAVEGCTRNDRGGGRCAYHGGGKRCKVEDCMKPSRKHGLCAYHYRAIEGPQRPR